MRYLNTESFRQFGVLLSEGSIQKKPNHHCVFLPAGAVSGYRTTGAWYLAGESGVAVLSVSLDGESYEDFCLDKAVRLKSGIWFRLAGLHGKASVQMGGSAMPLFLDTQKDRRDFALRPKMQVQCLYTVFYQEKEAGFIMSGERHRAAELVYLDQGSLHCVAEGREVTLQAGEWMLIAPDQWHVQYADAGYSPRLVSITFDAKGLDWEKLSCRSFQGSSRVRQLIQKILHQESGEQVFSWLTLLLLQLQNEEEQEAQLPLVSSHDSVTVERAQQYVQAHVLEKMTVPVVAAGIGISPSYLTALFHKDLGISPGEYIRRVKLQKSKHLIREGQLNFTQIAQCLQYSTVQHFSRQFKQMFGITPTEYENSVR